MSSEPSLVFSPAILLYPMSMKQLRHLKDWSFTQVGGGEGTKDGEWIHVSEFPTTVHVELLKLERIPDPV
jgi:beta-mannosidase